MAPFDRQENTVANRGDFASHTIRQWSGCRTVPVDIGSVAWVSLARVASGAGWDIPWPSDRLESLIPPSTSRQGAGQVGLSESVAFGTNLTDAAKCSTSVPERWSLGRTWITIPMPVIITW